MNTLLWLRRSAYLAVIALQLLASGCSDTPPTEQGIALALEEIGIALEARQSGPVLNRLHENFRSQSPRGALDRKQVQTLLLATFYRHKNISITLTNLQVQPDPMNKNRADASFNIFTSAGSGDLLPDTGQIYRIDSQWQRTENWQGDGDWQLLSLNAKRALEG